MQSVTNFLAEKSFKNFLVAEKPLYETTRAN